MLSSMSFSDEVDVEKLAGSGTSSEPTSPTVTDTVRMECAIPTVAGTTPSECQGRTI